MYNQIVFLVNLGHIAVELIKITFATSCSASSFTDNQMLPINFNNPMYFNQFYSTKGCSVFEEQGKSA